MKRTAVVVAVILVAAFGLAGCGSAQSSASSGSADASAVSSASTSGEASASTLSLGPGQAAVASAGNAGQKGDYTYEQRELWVDNGGEQIYGVAYVPEGEGQKPLVVFSHGLGNDHSAGAAYADVLASRGFAVYAFDFRGGSASRNRSDGSSTSMSVMTEASDLEAVVEAAKGWDFVDPSAIVAVGESQGGCVSAVYAAEHAGELAGLVLLYPALSIPDDIHSQFASLADVPDTYGLFGGWMTVGRNYAADMWDYDVFARIGAYSGKVLVLHGGADSVVDVSYSERAAQMYPNCELHVISGAGHGFTGTAFEEACGYLIAYLGGLRN